MSKPLFIKRQRYEWRNFIVGWLDWEIEVTCPKCGKKYQTECSGTLDDACKSDWICKKCDPEQ
jgi:transposase-like protein